VIREPRIHPSLIRQLREGRRIRSRNRRASRHGARALAENHPSGTHYQQYHDV